MSNYGKDDFDLPNAEELRKVSDTVNYKNKAKKEQGERDLVALLEQRRLNLAPKVIYWLFEDLKQKISRATRRGETSIQYELRHTINTSSDSPELNLWVLTKECKTTLERESMSKHGEQVLVALKNKGFEVRFQEGWWSGPSQGGNFFTKSRLYISW